MLEESSPFGTSVPGRRRKRSCCRSLCHHRLLSSLRCLPAPHLCKAGDARRCDLGPHETVSVAQTPEARGWSCCGRGTRLGVPPCREALRGEAAGGDTRTPACPGEERDHGPRPPACCTPPDGACHYGPTAEGGEGEGRQPEALFPDNTREPPCPHPWWSPSGNSQLPLPAPWRWTL
jgi:hypothetical protein